MSDPSPADRTPSTLPGANHALALLLAINLFNYIDRLVLAAVESKIAHDLLPGDPHALAKMGSLATAFIVSYMISAPIFGWLADRMSRWLLVGAGVMIWSLASGASGLAISFNMLLITRLFVGVGEGGYGPAAPTIIADLFPLARRGQVMAWFYMAIPLGSALGYIFGGAILKIATWRWAFYCVVPPGLLLGVLCFLMRDPPRGVVDSEIKDNPSEISNSKSDITASSSRPRFRDYLSLFTNSSYLLDCAGMTAMTFAIGGISYWMPRYISVARGAGDLTHVNFVFGVLTAIAGIVATLLGGYVGDKLSARFPGAYFLVSGVAILLACPAVFIMLHVPFPAAWVAVFCAEFFLFFNTGPSNTILANVTSANIRATAFAVNILLIHACGDALSPPLLGAVVDRHSWNVAFYLVIATMALAGLLWLAGIPYLARDTARASGVNVQGQPVAS